MTSGVSDWIHFLDPNAMRVTTRIYFGNLIPWWSRLRCKFEFDLLKILVVVFTHCRRLVWWSTSLCRQRNMTRRRSLTSLLAPTKTASSQMCNNAMTKLRRPDGLNESGEQSLSCCTNFVSALVSNLRISDRNYLESCLNWEQQAFSFVR